MDNRQALVSAALLEAIWGSRKKDMIDLITPFILYAVATKTSPGGQIDTKAVQRYVQENYAYPDLPESIIKAALARNPFSAIERREKQFYLVKPLDDEITRMDQRTQQCDEHISLIGDRLSAYLTSHCKKKKSFSKDDAIIRLHSFFSRYGLEIGTENLAGVQIKPEQYEVEYYIARFIFECKDSDARLYSYIIDLVKGYFLRLAIYIQPENGNLQTASFANTGFIFDTPVLIDLLGYQGVERENNALSLLKMLKRQKANLYFFPHIKQEMINILTAYKYSLIPGTTMKETKTLAGLDARGYDSSDVEREIVLLESKLEGGFGIKKKELPPYATKSDNTVDESQVLGEEEIKKYIKDNTPHYTEDNLNNDITSVLAIHKLREGETSRNIESCRFVFVTNNIDFIQAFNKYYRNNVDRDTFQLSISVNSLSAIAWIKCGEVENLSETELLKNAYCAMQPIPEILSKLEEVLLKLMDSGSIQAEQVVALRASRVFQNDLWTSSFGDLEAINEYSVTRAKKKYEESLIIEKEKEHREEIRQLNQKRNEEIDSIKHAMLEQEQKHSQEILDLSTRYSEYIKQRDDTERINEKKRNESIRMRADEFARKERNEWLAPRIRCLKIIVWVLFALGIIGLIASFAMSFSWWIDLFLCVYCLISACSIYDTLVSKRAIGVNWLVKKSNQYETKVREEKILEYSSILQEQNNATVEEPDMHLLGV